MITEDKVTEIFCITDDFCKVFDVYFGFFFMAKSSAVIACEKYTASCAA